MKTQINAELMKDLELLTREEFGYAEKVAMTALKALLYEVSVTPKPGLVDRTNSGAHTDMDFFTFLDSSCALLPYFREVTLCGMTFEGLACELLPLLRPAGLRAEDTMLKATDGVNTHKGLIFSLGILCAAQGYCFAHEQTHDLDGLLSLCAEIAHKLPQELETCASEQPTAGEAAFINHGFTGARGEAASGFSSVRQHGHPVLKRLLDCGCSLNDAGVVTLLSLMAHVTDTNIINRSSLKRLHQVQAQVKDLLRTNSLQALLGLAEKLDHAFISEHLSPGGCADMLSISYFLWLLPQL